MKATTGKGNVGVSSGGTQVAASQFIYIYIPGTQPTHFFGGLTFNFMGQIFQNMGHLGSRYIYIFFFFFLDMACIHSGIN